MYFPFLIPKSGRKRSAHGRRRFIQRFQRFPPPRRGKIFAERKAALKRFSLQMPYIMLK